MKTNNRYRHFAAALSLVVLASGVLLSPGNTVLAQELTAEHLAAARTTIATTNATKKLNDILPSAVARISGQLISNRPDIEAEITTIVNATAIELAARRGDLEKEAAKIYARVFSQEELVQIGKFFGTETGKKFLNELPIIVREVDKAARVWGTGINRDLSQKVTEKLKKDGLL